MVDQTDLEILYYLNKDPQVSNNWLSNKLEVSPATITYRISKLKKEKYILGFSLIVNWSKLTPSYQAYLIQIQVRNTASSNFLTELLSINFLTKVYHVAGVYNYICETIPISNLSLKTLTEFFSENQILNFQLIPILNSNQDIGTEVNIEGEAVDKLYCPECQSTMSGRGFVREVQPNHLMAFCCENCYEEFKSKYANLFV